jgi:hypothetical protein
VPTRAALLRVPLLVVLNQVTPSLPNRDSTRSASAEHRTTPPVSVIAILTRWLRTALQGYSIPRAMAGGCTQTSVIRCFTIVSVGTPIWRVDRGA